MLTNPDPVPIPDPTSSEPALAVGTITAVVGAVLALAVAFGLSLTPAQSAAVLGVTTVLAPLISAWFTRSRVYSPQSVARMLTRNRTGRP
jgi:hypothetical protein